MIISKSKVSVGGDAYSLKSTLRTLKKTNDRTECLHTDAKCSLLFSQTPLEYKNMEGDSLKFTPAKLQTAKSSHHP